MAWAVFLGPAGAQSGPAAGNASRYFDGRDSTAYEGESGAFATQAFSFAAVGNRMTAPIAAADGGCCVTGLSCLDCGPSCSLTCVQCNASDVYQLFEYNASTGAVVVPDAAAPQCAKHGRPAMKGPWCWNLFANARKPGTAIDAYPCGYPTSDALLGPGKPPEWDAGFEKADEARTVAPRLFPAFRF